MTKERSCLMTDDFFSEGMAVLRIYTAEKDHYEGLPFYEWIVQKACSYGLSGATVLRGIGGYCLGNPVLAPQFHQIRINQPVVVEIIDKLTDLENFIKGIEETIPKGLMTLQPVAVRYYGKKKK
ncbi:MAG: DUF190 domain-containing protein [Lentisphaerae bacterium]|nr:DUF190 domain-containing protein [Lentisphaerota bacterium]